MAVRGGDGDADLQAALTFEAGGPIETAPETWGEPIAAAIGLALRSARAITPIGQLLIRAEPETAATAAGLGQISSRDYRRLQQIGGQYEIAGAQPNEGLAWSDRAQMIAERCLPTQGSRDYRAWGTGTQLWPALQLAEMPEPDACSICMEDFTDVLPSGSWTSRAPSGLFACNHAVCRGCDWDIQNAANPKCPLCRQPRVQRTRTRP